MNWDHELTTEQKLAASHYGSHARLLSGPGTGKTLVMTRRIQYLIQEKKVEPQNILALTFTRFAAYELKKRVADSLGISPQPRISTLHSFALRQLIRNKDRLDVLPKPLRVADDWEENNIINPGIKNLLSFREIKEVKKLFNDLSSDWELNNTSISTSIDPKFIGAWHEQRNIFGYTLRSELVYQLKRSLEQIEDFQLEKPIKYLLVDEYQDLNPCDLAIIKFIEQRGAELFVAGDDDQSIYGFRNAYPDGIRDFHTDYENVSDLPLKSCKRCDPNILAIGEFVARLDPRRIEKDTFSENKNEPGLVKLLRFNNELQEVQGIGRAIKLLNSHEHIPYGDFLVLLRVDTRGSYTSVLFNELDSINIPYNYDSEEKNPLNQNEGREFISFLRISRNIEDHLAWRALLAVRRNNIGDVIINSIYKIALENSCSFYQALMLIKDNPHLIKNFGDRVVTEIDDISEQLKKLDSRIKDITDQESTSTIDESVEDLVGCIISDETTRLLIVNELLETVKKLSLVSISELLDFLMDSSAKEEPHIDRNKVNILTMHKAKGLSSNVVFIMVSEDEHIPGREEKEPGLGDERRLLFVSMTRAKHYLFISYCNARYGPQRMLGRSSGNIKRSLTRFLRDSPLHPEPGMEYIENFVSKKTG